MKLFDRLFKKSAGTQILTSADLARELRVGSGTTSSISVSPTSAMHHVTIFSCVRVLSEGMGIMPCELYERSGTSKSRAVEHPLYDLLRWAPNSQQTAQEFWEMYVAHLATRGNFYCYINRVGGEIRELIPFHPDAVQPRLNLPSPEIIYNVTYVDGSTETLTAKEVLHVKLFSMDGVTGLNPIAQNREAIGLAMAMESYGSHLFANGARPGGVLSTDRTLSEPARKRLEDRFETMHQGLANAHRLAVLEEGLKYQQTTLTSEDAQFLESRKYSKNDLCGLMRVPPHLIADLERATFTNNESQGRSFVDWSLMPYLGRAEQRICLQLLTPAERKKYLARFDPTALLRGDMAARAAFYKSGIGDGWLTRNEARESEDKDPIDGLEIPLMPLNMTDGRKPPSFEPAKEQLAKVDPVP